VAGVLLAALREARDDAGSGWLVPANGIPRKLDADRSVVEVGGLPVTFWFDHQRSVWIVAAPPDARVNGSNASSAAQTLRPGDAISAGTGRSERMIFWTDRPERPVNPAVAAVELRFRLRQLRFLIRWLDVDGQPPSGQGAGSHHGGRSRWLRIETVRLLAAAGNVDEARQQFVELEDPRGSRLAPEALVRAVFAGSADAGAVETLIAAMPSPHHADSVAAAMAKLLSERGDTDGAAAWAARAGGQASEYAPGKAREGHAGDRNGGLDGFAVRSLEDQVYVLARRGLVDQAYGLAGPVENPYRKTPWSLIELSIAEGVAARARDLIAAGGDDSVGNGSSLETLLESLPDDVGTDAHERHVTWAVIAAAPLDHAATVGARFLEQVRDRLVELRQRAASTWSDADRLLVGLLDDVLEREFGSDVDRALMRDIPEVAENFGGINEHPGRWRRALLRDRLRIAALVAGTGGAAWLGEVPYDGRRFLYLHDLMRMWTRSQLARYLPALQNLLHAGPPTRSAARPAFIAAWIELIHTLVELDPQLRRLGLVEGALQVVTELRGRLQPRTGFSDLQSLLPGQLPAQLSAAGQGLRDLVGSRTPAVPGSPAWNVLVGLRGTNLRVDVRELLDILERVWIETGSQEAGNAAARAHQRAAARELLGYDPVDARDTAPLPLVTELDGERVTAYVSDDIIEILHIGHAMKPHDGPLESCLDCVGGHAALHAQDYLHLRIGVMFVARTLPDGRNEILGAAPMFLTDSGLVALDAAASRSGWDVRPVLREYVHGWAQNVPRVYGPTELNWTPRADTEWMGLPTDAPQTRVHIVLEADGNPDLASDLTGAVSLPHHVDQVMIVWTPRADRAETGEQLRTALDAIRERLAEEDPGEGGFLAINDDLSERDRAAVLAIAAGLPYRRLVTASHPALPDVPSDRVAMRVWIPSEVRRGFEEVGRAHLLSRLIAFSFRAGDTIQIALLGPMLREIFGHIDAGRLRADWLHLLVYYEIHFRILSETHAYNDMTRKAFARWLLDQLLDARADLLTGPTAEWWRQYHHERLSIERVAGMAGVTRYDVETEFRQHGLWMRSEREPEPAFVIAERDAAPTTLDHGCSSTSACARRLAGRTLVELLDRRAEVVARIGSDRAEIDQETQGQLIQINARIVEIAIPQLIVDAYQLHRGLEGQTLALDMVELRLGTSFLAVRFDEWGLPVMSVPQWHASAEQRITAALVRVGVSAEADLPVPEDLPEDVARIWRLYGLGLDDKDIAALTGGTPRGVIRMLRQHRLPLRLISETRQLRSELDAAVVADHVGPAVALWQAGQNPADIAAELGIDLRLVYLALRQVISPEAFRDRYSIRGLTGEPGGGVTMRRYSADEHRGFVQVVRPLLDRLPASERGRTILLRWLRLRARFAEIRLPDGRIVRLPKAGDEVIAYTVFDSARRPWRVEFEHVRAEIDALIDDGFLPARFNDELDSHEAVHARNRWATHPEHGWPDHAKTAGRIADLLELARADARRATGVDPCCAVWDDIARREEGRTLVELLDQRAEVVARMEPGTVAALITGWHLDQKALASIAQIDALIDELPSGIDPRRVIPREQFGGRYSTRDLSGGSRRDGGAIAVRLLSGESAQRPIARSVPLRDWHRRAVLAWIGDRLDQAERLEVDHPDYMRADSRGRWRDHGVRLYALPELRDSGAEFAPDVRILMFVAPDVDGVLSVFVDPVVLVEQVTLRVFDRALLAERELVRILHPQRSEREVQAMVLPPPTVLGRLATVTLLGSRRIGLPVRALEGVRNVEKLGVRLVRGGRAKAASAIEAGRHVVLKQPSGSPRPWFDSVVASRQPRAEGHRAVASELAVAGSAVPWGAGVLLGRGEVVGVAPFLTGRPFTPADLRDPRIHAQVIDHLAERVLVAGDDVLEPGNLLVVGGVELWGIDFDRTPLVYGKFVDHLRLALIRLRERDAVAVEELATQLADLSDRRVELLAALPNQRLRDIVADHLDWVDRVLDRGVADSLEGLLEERFSLGRVSQRDRLQERQWGLVPASARLLTGIELMQLVDAGEDVLVRDFILNSELPASQRTIFGKWLVTTARASITAGRGTP
jgi:hypothetical protein